MHAYVNSKFSFLFKGFYNGHTYTLGSTGNEYQIALLVEEKIL